MIGSRIGHIRVTGAIGQGGMGEVYRGIDERLNRPVALKVIRADNRLSAEARGRFLREARMLSSLDHPSICRIHEYIESDEGDFLVLELVEGTTLERAIELGMSRARKLRIAIEIADALAAAHRKGIVHRDLKPENVMIANDGTAKVLDFGVARHHGDEERPPAPSEPETIDKAATLIFSVTGASTGASGLPMPVTAHGIAVGTPAFMSPEQAAGKIATPASDMYSFGLLLQTLFTEVEPHPLDLGSSALMMRAAAGISDPVLNQPRDVTQLIDRLKSLAAADRPTAVETLSILKRIVDRPRRRTRQAVLAFLLVLVVGAAIKYVVDVTSARREAERRRQQAESLVSFMVGDLRTKLEAVGRLDVLDGAASRALAYFASLSPEELRGEDLHRNALALAQLGEVRMNEGKLDQAVQMFRESLRFASAAVARDPKKEEWQLALSNAHFWLGDALRRKGDSAGTLQHFREYLEISERLAAAHPGDSKYELEVSYGHGNIGAAHEAAGHLEEALAEYQVAVAIDRERLRRDGSNEVWQIDLADSLNRVAVMQQRIGALRSARQMFAEELPLRRQLLSASPRDTRRVTRLATCLGWNGQLQQMMGDSALALASWREELALSTRLSELDPQNMTSRRNRAVAMLRVATVMPDRSAALPLATQAVQELQEVVRAGGRPTWRHDLAYAMIRKADVAEAAGDRRTALTESRAALALIESIAAAEPGPQTLRILGDALLRAAGAEDQGGDPATARRHRLRAAALVTGETTSDPRFLALQARTLMAVGRTAEAAALITRLDAAGYRDPDLSR
jgi:serine/threonine-protein kinase